MNSTCFCLLRTTEHLFSELLISFNHVQSQLCESPAVVHIKLFLISEGRDQTLDSLSDSEDKNQVGEDDRQPLEQNSRRAVVV